MVSLPSDRVSLKSARTTHPAGARIATGKTLEGGPARNVEHGLLAVYRIAFIAVVFIVIKEETIR
jgi:hypothetical protein